MGENMVMVMGIGNWLMQDEGVGVHIVRLLEKEPLPSNVELVDGGTGGFHLLEYFQRHKNVILIDATLDNNPVGTIRLIKPKFAADFPKAMSTHDIGLKDLVSALQLLNTPVNIYLFVVSIKSIQEQGIELSAEVAAVLPKLKTEILSLINSLIK